MDILSKLPFINNTGDDTEGAEPTEAELKAERIKFHRRQVRNGPANFKVQTNGQVKRERKRALARQTRKDRRRQIRKYHAEQREAATLRGHLQAARVLPFFRDDFAVGPKATVQSITWIVQHYTPESLANEDGRVEVTEEVVTAALTAALNRWQTIVGFPPTKLSPAYTLPVALSA